jgi:hypothetical protein
MSLNKIEKLPEQNYGELSEQEVIGMEKRILDHSKLFGKRKYKLEELLKDINEDNIHEETDFGEPLGKEIIE